MHFIEEMGVLYDLYYDIANRKGGGINDRPSDQPVRQISPLQHFREEDIAAALGRQGKETET
jgi:hypothetical protein